MESTIYEALLEAAGTSFPPHEQHETHQQHLARLAERISQVDDAVWAALRPAAQEWYNAATAAANSKQDIAAPDGFPVHHAAAVVAAAAPAAAVIAETTTDTTVPSATAAVPVATAQSADSAVPVAAAPAAAKRGRMQALRQYFLLHGDNTPEQAVQELEAQWGKLSVDTAYLCRDEVKNVLRAASANGQTLVHKAGSTDQAA